MQASILNQPNIVNGVAVTKVNVGCGNNKIDDYWNIDANEKLKPDQVVDIKHTFPFNDNSLDEILFFHTIEHIEEKHHIAILSQFHRALKLGGVLYISYPEFSRIALNYLENHQGLKQFWKHTIYGLQRDAGDYHVSLMDTTEFAGKLQSIGFIDVQYKEEPGEPYNTIIRCYKGDIPYGYEDVVRREIYKVDRQNDSSDSSNNINIDNS